MYIADFKNLPLEEQTEEICIAAVSKYAEAIQYVEKQTEEICLIAVQKAPILR